MRLIHRTIKTYITPACSNLLCGAETISLNQRQIYTLLPLDLPSSRYKYIFYYSICSSCTGNSSYCALPTLAANKRLAELFSAARPFAPHLSSLLYISPLKQQEVTRGQLIFEDHCARAVVK